MAFEALLGQPGARTVLERALASGRVHHAYRFEGPDGVGKRFAADLLAQALLCEHGTGCGECSACRRAVTLAPEAPHVPRHPDHLLVQRGLYPPSVVGASEATGISVEQIRKIVLPRMGFPPHEGRALVVTIADAHELTISAANALLKTLEEPPERTHFILLTSRPERLPDTIRSRALKVRFSPLPRAILQSLLGGPEMSPEVISLAQGSLELARKLSDPKVSQTRDDFVSRLRSTLSGKHPARAIAFAEERPEGRDELLELLTHLGSVVAYEARKNLLGLSGPEQKTRGRALAAAYFEVERSVREVELNGAPALALEGLVLRLSELKASPL